MKPLYIIISLSLVLLSCKPTKSPDKAVKNDSIKHSQTADTLSSNEKATQDKLHNIAGYYEEIGEQETGDGEGCDVTFTITKAAKGYRYYLKESETEHEGKLTITTGADGSRAIVFEGIEYAEYEGDINKNTDSSITPELPVGIDGWLDLDTIKMQNYGNSMNYYVKFSSCGKYLRFVKKKK
jgi:hypothetical protein